MKKNYFKLFTKETEKELDDLKKKGWSVPYVPHDEHDDVDRAYGSLTQTYMLTRKLSASEVKLRKDWLNNQSKTYIASKKYGL